MKSNISMAFQCFYKRGLQLKISEIDDVHPELKTSCPENLHLSTNWEDVTCSICLDYPHNGVLLQCSSYDKGCRPFVCDTNHLHSNCLERFETAYGLPLGLKSPSMSEADSTENTESVALKSNCKPSCPLCRGEVNGWVVIEEARLYLDLKKRCCEVDRCAFVGTYLELQKHAQLEHPDSHPSKIDPAKQLDWDNFQQSSEIIDVLSSIHSETPHGVVLGDYVIEYGDDDYTVDEFEDFSAGSRNWWTSCILYQIFDNFRNSRNRRRSRTNDTRSRRSSFDTSNSDDGSVISLEFTEQRGDDNDEEFVSHRGDSWARSSHWSSQRRRSRFSDN